MAETLTMVGTVRAKLLARIPFLYRRQRMRDFQLMRYLAGCIRAEYGPADAYVSGSEDSLAQSLDERRVEEKYNDSVRWVNE